jgi:hypothetical protein
MTFASTAALPPDVDLEVVAEELDDRAVRRGPPVRHRPALEDQASLAARHPRQLVQQAGLANAGLPDHPHELELARPGLREGGAQHIEFMLPSHEFRQSSGLQRRLEPTPHRLSPDELERLRSRRPDAIIRGASSHER